MKNSFDSSRPLTKKKKTKPYKEEKSIQLAAAEMHSGFPSQIWESRLRLKQKSG